MAGEVSEGRQIEPRRGFKMMDTLPGAGPGTLQAVTVSGVETVIAICPTEQPRFYQDGKLVQVGLAPHA